MQTKNLTLIILFIIFSLSAHAQLQLPKVIGSNMVLQRGVEVPIRGWDDPGKEVSVLIGNKRKVTKVAEDGKWTVSLDPMEAGGPHKIQITSGQDQIILNNVLFGEVWICSGQSNMEWSVRGSNNPEQEIANAKYPKIRLFHIPKKASTFPERDCNASWKECSPESVANFSAVAYYFGRHLQSELNVPIGLVGTAWGAVSYTHLTLPTKA